MIFLLITQKHFLTLGHIMAEIATMSRDKWPPKFLEFESCFKTFYKQRVKNKPLIGAIVAHKQLIGFLNTLAGYSELLDAQISACKTFWTGWTLKRSHSRLKSLQSEISAQLNEQNFNVN